MTIRALVPFACLPLLAPLAGCYQSTVPLGPPERSAIDRALVGSWSCVDPKDASNRAVVTSVPIDRHSYEIEWREAPDRVTRYRAHATRLSAESLLNVVETGPAATDRRYVFLRAKPTAGGGLAIAVVQDDAVKGKSGVVAVREIARRAADPALYGPFATCTATVARP